MTDFEIEKGWHETFSTNNPFCPCDLKSFKKAVRWAEHTLTVRKVAAAPDAQAAAPQDERGGVVSVSRGALQAAINMLRRDADEGRAVRGELADELSRAGLAAEPAKSGEPVAYLVRGLNSYNEEYASAWIGRANADAAAAVIFRASITPLVEARAALDTMPARSGETVQAPYLGPVVLDRSHPNQAYVTYGFSSEDECTQFIKATRRGYQAAAPQPAQTEQSGDPSDAEIETMCAEHGLGPNVGKLVVKDALKRWGAAPQATAPQPAQPEQTSTSSRQTVGQTQIDALIAEHSEWTPHGSAIVDGHRRTFAKALLELAASTSSPT